MAAYDVASTIHQSLLSGLRSAAVTATEAHRRGRKVSAPTQLGTAAVDFLSSAFDGRALLSMVVTLSPAPGSGWETWFACTYGEDLAKLRQGLTLVHFSAQPEPFLSLKSTEPTLNVTLKKCSRQAEKWTSVSP